MNLLLITPYLPSETSGHAGAQLIFRNITSLAKNHDITLASFIDSDEYSMIGYLVDHGIEVHTIAFPRNQKSRTILFCEIQKRENGRTYFKID